MVMFLDVGMCGDYNFVIGMEKVELMCCFVIGMLKGWFMFVLGEVMFSGVYVEIDDKLGVVIWIEMVW